MVFVIFIFSAGYVEKVISFLEGHLPFLKGQLSSILLKQKYAITNVVMEGEKPLVALLWDYFIILMISYFLVSIVNSLAQGHLNDLKEEEKAKKDTKAKKSK